MFFYGEEERHYVLRYNGESGLRLMPSDHDLYLIGDQHLGNIGYFEGGLEKAYDSVLAAPNRFVVQMGDRIDCITWHDKRYDHATRRMIPHQQTKEAIKQDARVAERTLTYLIGNHEAKLSAEVNFTEMMCDEAGCPYGNFTSILEMHDKHGFMYSVFVTHGFGQLTSNAKDREQQLANMKASLKMKLREEAGNCLLMAMGHTHQLFVVEPTHRLYLTYEDQDGPVQHYQEHDYAQPQKQFIDIDCRWYANTGSFLKKYPKYGAFPGYVELRGYKPSELGYVVAHVRDRKIVSVERVVV